MYVIEDRVDRPPLWERVDSVILRHIYLVRFFDMEDGYQTSPGVIERNGTVTASRAHITDVASQIVTVRVGDYEKRVLHYHGGPPDLINLIEMIDKESGVEQWVK